MNWNTRITELLQIKYPIIQGGLGYLGYANLAAAVSNAGGLGQITAMSLPNADALRQEIQRARTLTDKPFGVNFAIGIHGVEFKEWVQIAMDEKIPIVSITGGNPTLVMEMLQPTDIKSLVLVSSCRQAQKAEQLGASAVIVVGQEGGGHLGRDDVGTMVIVPRVVDVVNIPVIASGGIGDGRGWMAAHALGADGIQMGTRFIATQECVDASTSYKMALIESSESDTAVIKRSIHAPARVLRSDYIENILEIERVTPTYEALEHYISGEANKRWIHDGIKEEGFGWAGQVTGMIHDIPTVAELIERMVKEAEMIRGTWGDV
ncbi:NAD(P)H-dependent flavin oxidoreductase [Paenibacillus macquariensis]|uniref:Probable nitronate monooxygenase n=1 Tax=Paenibacillus macquariensis TaxID=948756 RepID=A0ABY1JQ06_9BACL|nr:nitronate monooxygenase family protein [Paenibacillus macquariensis]MEC0094086.1 nitronate monooxygenase family protein [Paenibacillus macquariensis]OAB37546.1 2-nitropropane dioxygenase [Paenibacillus macquariensis subsp. macquariensis]SIQ56025.1 enoyl-[acyl-carrier protein] reductase II [Paenibacillus macquariensis]